MTLPTYDPTNVGNTPGHGPLRAGGQPATMPIDARDNLPSTTSKAHDRQMPALTRSRDVFGGQDVLLEKAGTYLPASPGETPANYRDRQGRSPLFNLFKAAVETCAGFVMRKPPTLGDDMPAPFVEQWENIDNAGTHGNVFAHDILLDALTVGHAAILVDFPATDGTQTHDDEARGLIRPYWVPIKKEQILSWRETVVDGRAVLSQVVLKETSTAPKGAYGEAEVVTYRVLYRDETGVVGWRRETIVDGSVIRLGEGVFANQEEIPLAVIRTSGKVATLESVPPLDDVAQLNVAHFQQYSDYANSIHKTNTPLLTLVGFGEAEGEVVAGPNTVLMSSNPQAKAAYVAHDGAALGSSKTALDDLVAGMATVSVSMLAPDKKGVEAAESKKIGKGATDSKLGVSATGLEDGLERAAGFHCRYFKGSPAGGSITVNREFTDMTMAPEMLTALTNAWEKMKLPTEPYLDKLVEGGVLPEGTDIPAMSAEMEAAQVAKEAEERERQEREAELRFGARPGGPSNTEMQEAA